MPMGLTVRDGLATLLMAGVVVVMLAAGGAWNWSLIGDARAATLAIWVLGFGMCLVAGPRASSAWRPWRWGAAGLGVVSLGVAIAGLVWPSIALAMALGITIAALWLVSTVAHLVST